MAGERIRSSYYQPNPVREPYAPSNMTKKVGDKLFDQDSHNVEA